MKKNQRQSQTTKLYKRDFSLVLIHLTTVTKFNNRILVSAAV